MDNSDDISEDEDYLPMGESSSDDEMSDHELASDDEEYVEARRTIKKFKKHSLWSEYAETEELSMVLHNGNEDMVMHSDYEYSDCDYALISEEESSEEFECNEGYRSRRKKTRHIYDPKCDHKTLEFELGMRFESVDQCKAAIQRVAIFNGQDIQYLRSNKNQLEARCDEGCPWRLYASKISTEGTFAIKRLINEHRCHRNMNTRQVTAEWIAKEYVEKFRKNPNWTIDELEADMLEKYAVQPKKWKLYRGKWRALEMLRGSVIEHYAGLRNYMAELMRVDRDGRFEFLLEDDSSFKAFYIGFSANRKGFLNGCRPIIGFDGCFLKTFLGGALLCATAKDGNNQMYPIAWAVVATENESCWKWFLTILFDDLNISDGLGYTFISDQQKGLMNAILELTPHAEHRNCARHVYMNWKKKFKGQRLKNIFWRIVLSTHVAAYNSALEDLKEEDEMAYLDFLERSPSRFCKAFVSTIPTCDMIDNNISETFNGYIVKARRKHIIEMLEDIRGALMTRQHEKLMKMSGVTDTICPRIRTKVEANKLESRLCVTKPAVGNRFQVAFKEDQFVVDLNHNTCTCRIWNLTGIPCIHACSAIHFLKKDVARKKKLQTKRRVTQSQKERTLARKGFGVLQFEDTGNIYMNMPDDRRLHFVSGRGTSTPNSTSAGIGGTRENATQ